MKVRRLGAIAIGSNSVRMLTANLDETLSDPVRGRVETSLFLSMDEKKRFSEAGMERVAQAVRRLAEEGFTLGDLKNACRGDLAQALLGDGGLTIGAVAQRVGFSDSTTFSRAFRQWTGHAPGAWRDRHPAA